ncbi:MAG: alpha/beta fold hydrolase [Akkermansiaceae bacterium]|nr:alpha/beta fold hydrolase [Akkermansiaceae bacterium]
MREEILRTDIDGRVLHQLIIHPADDVDVRAQAIFYHGHGDYAERYLDVLHPFVDRGIRCIITDLPGHGHSPGIRGHCGDVKLLDAVIKNTLEYFKRSGNLPYGVMGHSMGGLLAARHLVLAGQGELPHPSFAWLSSPLVNPSRGRRSAFLRMARILAPVVPGFTFSTHVKPENFSAKTDVIIDDNLTSDEECITKHRLWHNRVSLGWGTALLDFSNLIHKHVEDIPAETVLLCTQGKQDWVCPAKITKQFFDNLPSLAKHYEEIEELRHEPFSGEGSERLFHTLESWVDSLQLGNRNDKKAPA